MCSLDLCLSLFFLVSHLYIFGLFFPKKRWTKNQKNLVIFIASYCFKKSQLLQRAFCSHSFNRNFFTSKFLTPNKMQKSSAYVFCLGWKERLVSLGTHPIWANVLGFFWKKQLEKSSLKHFSSKLVRSTKLFFFSLAIVFVCFYFWSVLFFCWFLNFFLLMNDNWDFAIASSKMSRKPASDFASSFLLFFLVCLLKRKKQNWLKLGVDKFTQKKVILFLCLSVLLRFSTNKRCIRKFFRKLERWWYLSSFWLFSTNSQHITNVFPVCEKELSKLKKKLGGGDWWAKKIPPEGDIL